jgi:hypothetical protein
VFFGKIAGRAHLRVVAFDENRAACAVHDAACGERPGTVPGDASHLAYVGVACQYGTHFGCI